MKTIQFLLLGVIVASMAACTYETEYQHRYHRPPPPPMTLPGEASRMPNPGAPEAFRAESQ